MANSKYEYVRSFEQPDVLLANTWIVVRIDGRGFSKFTTKYKFEKPNDRRALDLMNAAAEGVMKELPDLVLGYGVSDEYSFVFHKDCVLFERRASKLTTTIVSTFSSYYTFLWPQYFPDTPLTPPLPSFDGRAVCYPSDQNLRDYVSWRQVDCHINNLYNTTFWALVQQGGMDPRAAEQELAGTVASDKNEILFSRFGINYNNEPEIFKKGSVIYRDFSPPSSSSTPTPRMQSANSSTPPPLSHPQPRAVSQRLSLPILSNPTEDLKDLPPRGPTFLSTSTTPSPPPSSTALSFPAFPPTFFPVPTTSSQPPSSKPSHSQLIPLPLPPPTLTPSTGPLPSLNAPAVTGVGAGHNMPHPTAPIIPNRTVSSNAVKLSSSSSSTPKDRPESSYGTPSRTPARPGKLKHRSPSLSILEGGTPPQIPLRISSIPLNSSPRKLSLPYSHRSLKTNGLGNSSSSDNNFPNSYYPHTTNDPSELFFPSSSTSKPTSNGPSQSQTPYSRYAIPSPLPPLQTNKQLPAPPPLSSPDSPTIPEPRPYSHTHSHSHSDSPRRERSCSHTRIGSAPLLSSPTSGPFDPLASNPYQPTPTPTHNNPISIPPKSQNRYPKDPLPQSSQPPLQSVQQSQPQQPQTTPKTKNMSGNGSKRSSKVAATEATAANKMQGQGQGEGGWRAASGPTGNEGRPVEMSRTQKEKERKRRGRARIVVEHVDLIKEEFWERRPWILSGRAGV